jgi:hypothetical protein
MNPHLRRHRMRRPEGVVRQGLRCRLEQGNELDDYNIA